MGSLPRSIETGRARVRDELLDGELFYSLREAKIPIEQWRVHYNTVRPHSSTISTYLDKRRDAEGSLSKGHLNRRLGSFIHASI